jgi:hypothetical protein
MATATATVATAAGHCISMDPLFISRPQVFQLQMTSSFQCADAMDTSYCSQLQMFMTLARALVRENSDFQAPLDKYF